jgi:D-aspartate ligase
MAILSRKQSGRLATIAPVPAQTIGAIVLGGCFQGLGIVRSLGRKGIPVCVIDDETSISQYSRYTTHTVHVKSLREDRQIIDAILATSQRLNLNGWVLYPTRDEMVSAISRFREELMSELRIPTPDWDIIRWAGDKRNTYQLAAELDIPTPATWYPESSTDLGGLEEKLPLVIKPAIKEHFFYNTKAKAWRADNLSELDKRFQQAQSIAPGEAMLQELIPGGGQQQFSYCAFFKDDQALGSMIVCRRRQHPLDFGRASTFVETVDLPIIEELSIRFLQAIHYYGLVELEYKYDQRDQTYKLLDVNTRTWGYHSLGAQAGVDFSAMLFADQIGEKVEPCRARTGVKWIRLLTDLPTGMLEILHGRTRWPMYWQTLRSFDVEAVFDRHDLFPGVVELSLAPYFYIKRGF